MRFTANPHTLNRQFVTCDLKTNKLADKTTDSPLVSWSPRADGAMAMTC
jgi:hypothetical protein